MQEFYIDKGTYEWRVYLPRYQDLPDVLVGVINIIVAEPNPSLVEELLETWWLKTAPARYQRLLELERIRIAQRQDM